MTGRPRYGVSTLKRDGKIISHDVVQWLDGGCVHIASYTVKREALAHAARLNKAERHAVA